MKIRVVLPLLLIGIVFLSGCVGQEKVVTPEENQTTAPIGKVTESSTEKEAQSTETTLTIQQPKEISVKGLGETIESGGLAVTLRSVTPKTDYRPYETEDYLVVTMDVNVIGDKIYISPGKIIDARKYKINRLNMGELTWNLELYIRDSKNNVYKVLDKSGVLLGEKSIEVAGTTLRLSGIFDDLGYSIDNITIFLIGKDEKYKLEDLTKFIFKINLAEINNVEKCEKIGEYYDNYCVKRVAIAYGNLSYCYSAKNIFSCLYNVKLALEPTNDEICEWVLELANKPPEETQIKLRAYPTSFSYIGAECYFMVAKRTLDVSNCDKIPDWSYSNDLKRQCYAAIAIELKNPSICDKIDIEIDRKECVSRASQT